MKVKTKRSPIHGNGVFAIETIRRGEVILTLDDSRVVDDDHPIRIDLGENEDHCDYLPDGTTVLMAEPERNINQSCTPNVYVYSVDRLRFVLALRDVDVDEEITFDYVLNAVDGDVWECACGAENCRGLHKCGFFALPESRQLQYLPFLDPWFVEVHRTRVRDLLTRNTQMRS